MSNENQEQPVVAVEAVDEVVKKVVINSDGLDWSPHETTANTVADLLKEKKMDTKSVIVKLDESLVEDYENTTVEDNQVYSFIYRNKTGG